MLNFGFRETADNSGAHFYMYKIGRGGGSSSHGGHYYPGTTFVITIGRFLSLGATGIDKDILAGVKNQRIFPVMVVNMVRWIPRGDGSGLRSHKNKVILLDEGTPGKHLVGTGLYGPYAKECLQFFAVKQYWYLNEKLLYFL